MTAAQSLIAFIAAAGLLTITPGVDTAMVLRSAATGGTKRAAFAAAGIGIGLLLWGAAVSLGLGALLAASELAFNIVKWAGAAYLLWLGIGLLRAPRAALDMRGRGAARPDADALTMLRRGFLTNILNPKVGVFYITFLPQFIPSGANVALFSFLLACVHVLLGFFWFSLLIAAAVPLGRLLTRPKVVRTMDRLTGGLFIAFGIRLAMARQA